MEPGLFATLVMNPEAWVIDLGLSISRNAWAQTEGWDGMKRTQPGQIRGPRGLISLRFPSIVRDDAAETKMRA